MQSAALANRGQRWRVDCVGPVGGAKGRMAEANEVVDVPLTNFRVFYHSQAGPAFLQSGTLPPSTLVRSFARLRDRVGSSSSCVSIRPTKGLIPLPPR